MYSTDVAAALGDSFRRVATRLTGRGLELGRDISLYDVRLTAAKLLLNQQIMDLTVRGLITANDARLLTELALTTR